MKATEKKTLLVALGNPLSGDDGFGFRVLEHLRGAGVDLRTGVSTVDAGTDLLNHIESFAGYDHVVLLDAILDPEGKMREPGRVDVLDEQAFLSWSEASEGVHQISPLLAVKLFRTLHPEAKTQIHLVGLFVDRISQYPFHMTDERIEQAVAAVKALL